MNKKQYNYLRELLDDPPYLHSLYKILMKHRNQLLRQKHGDRGKEEMALAEALHGDSSTASTGTRGEYDMGNWTIDYNDTYFDYTDNDWLSDNLSEFYRLLREHRQTTNIALTVFLAVIFLIGTTGNVLVLAVFSRSVFKQASTIFIMGLAAVDLLICALVLPGVLLKEWVVPFHWDGLCQSWELLRCSTLPLSSLILVVVAVDRYILICRAGQLGDISIPLAKRILLLLVAVSVGVGVPPMLGMGVYQKFPSDGEEKRIYLGLCMTNHILISEDSIDRYWQAMACEFLLVLLVVLLLYGLVFRTVYRQGKRWASVKDCTVPTSGAINNNNNSNCVPTRGASAPGGCNAPIIQGGHTRQTKCGLAWEDKTTRNSTTIKSPGYAQLNMEIAKQNLSRDDLPMKTDEGVIRRRTSRSWCSREKPCTDPHPNASRQGKPSTSEFGSSPEERANDNLTGRPKKNGEDDIFDDGITSLDDGHYSIMNTSSKRSSLETTGEVKTVSIFQCSGTLVTGLVKKQARTYETPEGSEAIVYPEKKLRLIRKGWLKRKVFQTFKLTIAHKRIHQTSVMKLDKRQRAKIKMIQNEMTSHGKPGSMCNKFSMETTLQLRPDMLNNTSETALQSISNPQLENIEQQVLKHTLAQAFTSGPTVNDTEESNGGASTADQAKNLISDQPHHWSTPVSESFSLSLPYRLIHQEEVGVKPENKSHVVHSQEQSQWAREGTVLSRLETKDEIISRVDSKGTLNTDHTFNTMEREEHPHSTRNQMLGNPNEQKIILIENDAVKTLKIDLPKPGSHVAGTNEADESGISSSGPRPARSHSVAHTMSLQFLSRKKVHPSEMQQGQSCNDTYSQQDRYQQQYDWDKSDQQHKTKQQNQQQGVHCVTMLKPPCCQQRNVRKEEDREPCQQQSNHLTRQPRVLPKLKPQRRHSAAQVKTAKVLLLVTLIYLLSFAPVLLMTLRIIPSHPIPFYGYFIHSAANPLIYSFINQAFRKQLWKLFQCRRKRPCGY